MCCVEHVRIQEKLFTFYHLSPIAGFHKLLLEVYTAHHRIPRFQEHWTYCLWLL